MNTGTSLLSRPIRGYPGLSNVLTVADTKCDVGATRESKRSAGPVVRPCGSSSGAGIFRAAP
jgi:hypothetical protein